MSEPDWVAHSDKQERVLISDRRIVALCCGIQFGKTVAGAVRMKYEMHRHTDESDNFLIMSPTYKVMMQSTLPPFLNFMRGLGTYSKYDNVFKMDGGGQCFMRTGTDPDAIVGITNIRHVWVDEAGLFSLYAWENIQARAAFRQASIVLTTSPYTLNWIFKEIIRPKLKDPAARPDVELIQARSDENPYFPKEEYEQRRLTMDERRFRMMFGGAWERMAGLVYDCFDDIDNVCEPFSLPSGTLYYAGIDWGFSAPFAIVVLAIAPDGRRYQVGEFYRSGLTLTDKIQVAKQLQKVFGIKMFFCDPEEPASIEEFNRRGVHATAANNDVKYGVSQVYEMMKTRTFKVFAKTSPHTLDEMETYHWPSPTELRIDQDEKDPNPVGQSDHALDALRYVIVMTKGLGAGKLRALVPDEQNKQEDQFQRLERLKRRARSDRESEKWS